MGKTELVFKMQLAENANAASCIRLSSQLHEQTDGCTFVPTPMSLPIILKKIAF